MPSPKKSDCKCNSVCEVELNKSHTLLLMSDIHIDHPRCRLDLLKRHLDFAREVDAVVLIAGDLFDAMQLPRDPRRSYSGVKVKHAVDDYLDAVFSDVLETLRPYSGCIAGVAEGNHELSVLRYAATSLTQRIAAELNALAMPYRGWIRIRAGKQRYSLFYWHGAGGNAPVTRGVIDVARQLTYADADIIWNGHSHTAYIVPFVRERDGVRRIGYAIRTPSYVPILTHGSDFASMRGFAPQPVGCAMLRFARGEIDASLMLEA